MLATFIAAAVAGMAADTPVIQSAVWARAPSFADVAAAYPSGAHGVDGSATLLCGFRKDGLLTQCKIIGESPAGMGFGKAAKSLTAKFAVSVESDWALGDDRFGVEVPVRFVSPDKPAMRDHLISQPVWTMALTPAAVSTFFPAEAAAKGMTTGRGVAECKIDAEGALHDCRPYSAEPDGVGFSEAAAKAASGMRMSPWTRDGGPVDGATVRIPIRLTVEEPSPVADTARIVWLRTPTGGDVLNVFPRQALARNVAGKVDLRCRVQATGTLERCAVTSETPGGWGFGSAATSLAGDYRVSMRSPEHPEPGSWIMLSVPMAAMSH